MELWRRTERNSLPSAQGYRVGVKRSARVVFDIHSARFLDGKYFPTSLPISVCSEDEEVLTFDPSALEDLSSLLFSSDVFCCRGRYTWERPSS